MYFFKNIILHWTEKGNLKLRRKKNWWHLTYICIYVSLFADVNKILSRTHYIWHASTQFPCIIPNDVTNTPSKVLQELEWWALGAHHSSPSEVVWLAFGPFPKALTICFTLVILGRSFLNFTDRMYVAWDIDPSTQAPFMFLATEFRQNPCSLG